jgi:hypothetical protein
VNLEKVGVEGELAYTGKLFQIHVDREVEAALISIPLLQTTGRVAEDLADIGRGKLDAPTAPAGSAANPV